MFQLDGADVIFINKQSNIVHMQFMQKTPSGPISSVNDSANQ